MKKVGFYYGFIGFGLGVCIVVVLMSIACTPIQARRLVNVAKDVERITTAICGNAELFESFDLDVPAPEHCEKSIELFETDEYKDTIRSFRCIDRYTDEAAISECLTESGWIPVAEKIIK